LLLLLLLLKPWNRLSLLLPWLVLLRSLLPGLHTLLLLLLLRNGLIA
jgi:hypothetical protein